MRLTLSVCCRLEEPLAKMWQLSLPWQYCHLLTKDGKGRDGPSSESKCRVQTLPRVLYLSVYPAPTQTFKREIAYLKVPGLGNFYSSMSSIWQNSKI